MLQGYTIFVVFANFSPFLLVMSTFTRNFELKF